ncbi:MAG: CDP-diacylglycerol--serine O-phosphatidyltransferase [Archaeoglobaceae archaeon]
MRIFREVSLADSLTVLNALLGLTALVYSIYDYEKCFTFFYFALIADGLDGWIASKTERGRLGKELDSLADTISFSVFPAFLIALKHPEIFALSSLLLAFSILRLARFNVISSQDFIGVPTTVSAIMVTSLIRLDFPLELITIAVLVFSILMISDFRYPRIKAVKLAPIGILLVFATLYPEICYLFILISLLYASYPGVKRCEKLLLRSKRELN